MTELLTTPPEQLAEQLRKIAVFSDLPQEDLLWFVSQCQELRVAPGDIVMREGDKPEFMIIVLEGEIRARAERGSADGSIASPNLSGGWWVCLRTGFATSRVRNNSTKSWPRSASFPPGWHMS